MNKIILVATLCLSPLLLSACMFHGGNTEHVAAPTLGQELTDLQKSLEAGAVSEAEYDALKADLIAAKSGSTTRAKTISSCRQPA